MTHIIEPCVFLELLGLEALSSAFESNGIDGDMLSDLTADDLKEMALPDEHQPRLLWGIQQVLPLHNMLQGLGLQEHLPKFIDNEVGMDQASSLTKEDLIEIGIQALGHRKKILGAFAQPVSAAVPVADRGTSDTQDATTDPAELKKMTAQAATLKESMKDFVRQEENFSLIEKLPVPPGPGSDYSSRIQSLITREAACRSIKEDFTHLQSALQSAKKAYDDAGESLKPAQPEEGVFSGLSLGNLNAMTGGIIPGLGDSSDNADHPLKHYAEELGNSICKGIKANELQSSGQELDAAMTARTELEALEEEFAELDKATGFIAVTKAKGQQMMISGKIRSAQQTSTALTKALGMAVLQACNEEEFRCSLTISVLARLADDRETLAGFQEKVDVAHASIETKMPKWCEQTGMSNIADVADIESEADRLEKEHSDLLTETLDGLVTGCRVGALPSDFPLTERMQQLFSMEKQINNSKALIKEQKQKSGGNEGDNSLCNRTGADLEVLPAKSLFMHMDPLTALELRSGSAEERLALAKKATIALIYNCAQGQISAKLKAPGSARHNGSLVLNDNVKLHDNGVIEVKSFVDAQNPMGAMLRNNYKVWVYFTEVTGEGAEQTGKYGGKVVHMGR